MEFTRGEIKAWIIKRCNQRIHASQINRAGKDEYYKALTIKHTLDTIQSLRTECLFLSNNYQKIKDVITVNSSFNAKVAMMDKMLKFSRIYLINNPVPKQVC
jgi:hypothetical protein